MRRLLLPALALLTMGCGKDLTDTTAPPGPEEYDRVVLTELFTSLMCTNCPQAEAALDSLYHEEGYERHAVIHWHPTLELPDPLRIPDMDARLQAYTDRFGTVTGLPTCVFNGVGEVKGGNNETYAEYRSCFDDEMARKSPLSISLAPTLGEDSIGVDITIAATPDTTFENLDLTVVLVEHEVTNPWPMDPPTLSFVARTTSTESAHITDGALLTDVEFALNPDWDREKLYIVAFLQKQGIGEVFQAAMIPIE